MIKIEKSSKKNECKDTGKKKGINKKYSINLKGVRVGKLKVIKKHKFKGDYLSNSWVCKCDCGNETVMKADRLINKKRKSCGCGRKPDLLGLKFTKLLVVRKLKRKGKETRWFCECDCGGSIYTRTFDLKNGLTKGCGCLVGVREKMPSVRAAQNRLYSTYKTAAKARDISFNLSFKKFLEITAKSCYYCGCEPNQKSGEKKDFIHNGVDRVKNEFGYSDKNCVSACTQCNRAKLDYSLDEFVNWICKVYNHQQITKI